MLSVGAGALPNVPIWLHIMSMSTSTSGTSTAFRLRWLGHVDYDDAISVYRILAWGFALKDLDLDQNEDHQAAITKASDIRQSTAWKRHRARLDNNSTYCLP